MLVPKSKIKLNNEYFMFGVVVICVLIGLCILHKKKTEVIVYGGLKDSLNLEIYDGIRVSGREVLDVLDHLKTKDIEVKVKMNSTHIEPLALFTGKINKNNSAAITRIEFIQE